MNRKTIFIVIGVLTLLISLTCTYFWLSSSNHGRPMVVNAGLTNCYDYKSVNGFGFFTDAIRKRGGRVIRKSIVSPGLRRAEVIVWRHRGSSMPDTEVFEAMERFSAEGFGTIVFLHNDWSNEIAYLEELYRKALLEEREAARFYLRKGFSDRSEMDGEARFSEFFGYEKAPLRGSSPWFQVETSSKWIPKKWVIPQSKWEDVSLERITSDELPKDPSKGNPISYTGSYLVPLNSGSSSTIPAGGGANPFESIDDPDIDQLVAGVQNGSDATPNSSGVKEEKVFPGISTYSNNGVRILLVSDASFLANYGILREENQPIVRRILGEFPDRSHVVHFLETGPQRIVVSEKENERKQHMWQWMGMGMMPIVVINALIVAVLFCFARIPTFGVPSEFTFRNRNDMGDHLLEVGRMLQKSSDSHTVDQTIQHYYQQCRSSPIGKRGR